METRSASLVTEYERATSFTACVMKRRDISTMSRVNDVNKSLIFSVHYKREEKSILALQNTLQKEYCDNKQRQLMYLRMQTLMAPLLNTCCAGGGY